MKNYLSLFAAFVFLSTQAQKLNELSTKSQEDFNKEWAKAVQYGIPPTKYFKAKEDGSGTYPFLSKLPSVPKKVALVTFYVYDEGQIESSQTEIYRVSVSAAGGNQFSNSFLEKGLTGIKENFAARGMQVLTPNEFLDTPEKKKFYYDFVPNLSGFAKTMESAMKVGDGTAASADGYAYFYISDGRDFRLSESMGAQLCEALGVDAVLSVVNHCNTDGRYFGIKKVNLVMHGPNPIDRIPGHEYRGTMGANYQDGLLYQANWIDMGFLFKEKHPKKGVLFESYDGYDRVIGLLSKTMANNVADRCAGKLGDLKGN